LRVLIGDDNRLVLEGFRRALEGNEDIEIAGATDSGAYLMTLVERRRPDVVALEFDLRDVNGERCLDLITELFPEIKVVVLSSSSRPEVINSALSRGARAFIVKNVNPRDIPSALRQAYEDTVYHAYGFQRAPENALREAGLTEREVTMLKALARGLSNKAIGQELWISQPTVKFHLRNLYRKLGVENRLAAASYAHSHGVAVDVELVA
jgi:two-component system, NarL family, nitrate/nitrite response regulator NarL